MEDETRSAEQMVKIFSEDGELREKLKNDPIPVLKATVARAVKEADEAVYTRDRWFYRIAIGVLGLLALLAAGGSIALVWVGKQTPEVLVSLGSAAVGALVGLFGRAPTKK